MESSKISAVGWPLVCGPLGETGGHGSARGMPPDAGAVKPLKDGELLDAVPV